MKTAPLKKFFGKIDFESILWNILVMLSLISTFGGLIYKFYSLNWLGVILSLILATFSFIILKKHFKNNQQGFVFSKNNQKKTQSILSFTKKIFFGSSSDFIKSFYLGLYLLILCSLFYILWLSKTDNSIITPWAPVPKYFFLYFAMLTLILILYFLKSKKLRLPLLIAHFFLFFSVAQIIYKLGYGFDPFIHGATLDLIDKLGSVSPKQWYYLSEYGLITIAHKTLFIPISILNRWLVPVLASIFIPLSLKKFFFNLFDDEKYSYLSILLVLVVPLPFFIMTTPQNISYLFLLIAILLGPTCKNKSDLITIYIFSLTAFLSQPIAGIPAIIFSAMITIYYSDISKKLKNYAAGILLVFAIASLPLAFYFFAPNSPPAGIETLSTTANLSSQFNLPKIPSSENIFLNFTYLIGFNIKFFIAILIFSGIIISLFNYKNTKIFFMYALIGGGLFASYFISKKLNFDFLIDYERSNYQDRIFLTAAFFFAPFILVTFYSFAYKVSKVGEFIDFSFLFLSVIAISSSLYLTYPRFDNYHNSKGYSTGKFDQEAVAWIENNSDNPYIVLADQQVSAAALKKFGFSKYYKDDIFYYPIPTGGRLYQYYLQMVYQKANLDTAKKAMSFAGVDEAYFVLNKYWWAFSKIKDEASLEANLIKTFGNDEVVVFKYFR